VVLGTKAHPGQVRLGMGPTVEARLRRSQVEFPPRARVPDSPLGAKWHSQRRGWRLRRKEPQNRRGLLRVGPSGRVIVTGAKNDVFRGASEVHMSKPHEYKLFAVQTVYLGEWTRPWLAQIVDCCLI
jgi:hypothetical protein